MRSTLSTAVLISALSLVSGQTFTDCDPTKKTCPADPGLGKTITTDFTKGESSDWTLADGTTMSYGSDGAQFTIKTKTDAPTISSVKYIMFGKVSVVAKASPGTGTVSSFILESDDLDEIDWEWLGSTDSSVESNFFGKGNTTTYDRAIYHPVTTPIETFHTYTIDWTKDYVKWLIDDVVIRTLGYSDALALGGKNFPQTPMRIKMGNWIGCLDAAAAADPKTKGTCDWAGGPIDLSKGPFVMYAKSVTIQDYGCGGDYTYTDMSGSYQSISSSCKAGTSGSSAVSSSSSTKATSSSVSSGAILIETSSTLSTVKSSTTAAANTTASTTASSGSASTTAAAGTTTTTKATGTTTSTSTSTPAQASSNAASSLKPKHEYGVLDIGVLVLGLGLGYLVM